MMDSHNSHRIKTKDIAFDGKSYQLNKSYSESEGRLALREKIHYTDSWMSYGISKEEERVKAKNRLHVQKAIILFCLGKMD